MRFNCTATDQANSDVLWKEGAVIDAHETLKSGSSLAGINDSSIKLKQ
jgi:hypothetical protein